LRCALQHLKQAEIDALCSPKPTDTAAVNAWLNEYACAATAIGTHLVNVVCPVAVAEEMLATTYHRLENAGTKQVIDRASTGYVDEKEQQDTKRPRVNLRGSLACLHVRCAPMSEPTFHVRCTPVSYV